MRHLFLFAAFVASLTARAQQVIDCGHSHNDYTHRHPLSDALRYGYKSIEIDVWLHGGRLVVSHDGLGLDAKKDIEELYLKPIQERVRADHGHVYPGDTTPTIFMVEFKNDAEGCYRVLKTLIAKYQGLFCDRMGRGGPVKLLITGQKPWATLLRGNEQYVTADGDISQSADSVPNYIIERVSDPWGSYFAWRGRGQIPRAAEAKLDQLVRTAHDHGRQIRFYACPQNERLWRTLLDAGVDWINVDDLRKFAIFFDSYVKIRGKPKSCHCVRM